MNIITATYTEHEDGTALASYIAGRPEFTVLADLVNRRDLLPTLEKHHGRCDLLILHHDLPGQGDLLDTVAEIRRNYPTLRILYILPRQRGEELIINRLISERVYDFLVGEFSDIALLDAIRMPRQYKHVAHLVPADGQQSKPADTAEGVPPVQEMVVTKVLPNHRLVPFYSPSAAGVTTLAVNTAVALSGDSDLQVGLVDFNLSNPDILLYFDLFKPIATTKSGSPVYPGLEHLLPALEAGTLDVDELARHFLAVPGIPNLKVLPGLFDARLRSRFTTEHFAQILRAARQLFHITVVDTNSQFADDATYVAIREAGEVVLVATPSICSRFHLRRYLEIMDRLRLCRGTRIAVMNRMLAESEREADALKGTTGLDPVTQIPDTPGLPDLAVFKGKPLVLSSDNHAKGFRTGVHALAKAIYPMVSLPGAARETAPRASFLRRRSAVN